MEGYFVRSLGMHRVYNSAFMNMLRAEDNSKYRDVMKNVLRFNPEILRRFVNFMNNPDEEPAVHGFGKDDKYFGVATLMATMPGLPMFGHGQIEGFTEKYGMEYRRSYWDEPIDGHLVWRHEREIFPLLKKRRLFSGVENFVLYDFRTPEGHVNEDVFAYSNRYGDERSLVIYNNRYSEASGTISRSVGMNVDNHGRRHIVHKGLAEGLGLKDEDPVFYIFRDDKTDLEYLRNSRNLWREGLAVHLGAFKCHVFTTFREIYDHDGRCRNLEERLMGRGIPDVMLALRELAMEKVLQPFGALLSPDVLKSLIHEGRRTGKVSAAYQERLTAFFRSVREFSGGAQREVEAADESCEMLEALFAIDRLRGKGHRDHDAASLLDVLPGRPGESLQGWRIPALFSMVVRIRDLAGSRAADMSTDTLLEEWMLDRAMERALTGLGVDPDRAAHEVSLVKILCRHAAPEDLREVEETAAGIRGMLGDSRVQDFLGFNLFNDTWWFNRESMETLIEWMTLSAVLGHVSGRRLTTKALQAILTRACDAEAGVRASMESSGYEVPRLSALLDQAQGQA
jgi:hypothetical protein